MAQAKHTIQQAGFSLLHVMIVSLLLTGVGVAVVRNLGFSAKSTRTLSQVTDLEMLDFNLRESLSCEKTLNAQVFAKPALCTGSYTLRFHDGTTVPQVFGQWQIRARCPPGEKRLLVEAKGTNPADVTSKEWRPLSENTMSLCQHLFPGFSCPGGQSLKGSLGGMPLCLPAPNAGGFYAVRPFVPSVCRTTNPRTGQCSCPQGYSPVRTYQFAEYYGFSLDLRDPSQFGSEFVQPSHFYCDGNTKPTYVWANPADPTHVYRAPNGGCGTEDYICLPY